MYSKNIYFKKTTQFSFLWRREFHFPSHLLFCSTPSSFSSPLRYFSSSLPSLCRYSSAVKGVGGGGSGGSFRKTFRYLICPENMHLPRPTYCLKKIQEKFWSSRMTFSKTFVFLVIFSFLPQCLPPARFSKQTYVYPLFLDPSSNPQPALPPWLFIYCKKYCGAYEQKYVLTPE